MEHTKNTENINYTCGCLNNYTDDTFLESFGREDSEIKRCNNCPNMTYDNGILTCTKFC